MIKLNSSFHKKVANLKKMNKYMGNVAHTSTKAQAIMLIGKFRSGIIQNALGLKGLEESTVNSKERKGYTKPDTPLYGLGQRGQDRSYVNMLKLRPIKDGYTVFPSRKKHHDSDLTLQQLYIVHEFGATIKTKNGMIRIPPRPALRISMDKMKESSIRKEIIKFVNKAIELGIKGDFNEVEKFKSKFTDWDDYRE